jgi:hypothetical protein
MTDVNSLYCVSLNSDVVRKEGKRTCKALQASCSIGNLSQCPELPPVRKLHGIPSNEGF